MARKVKPKGGYAPPEIPTVLLDEVEQTVASPEWGEWAMRSFVANERSPLLNPLHSHLLSATVGFLLTNVTNVVNGKRILGTAQLGKPSGKPWPVAQRVQQLEGWFGHVPDFVITLDAVWMSTASTLQVCALVEHEMLHCAHKRDRWGGHVYDRVTGAPVFAIAEHDIEEFNDVVRRYGKWKGDVKAFAVALAKDPKFTEGDVDGFA